MKKLIEFLMQEKRNADISIKFPEGFPEKFLEKTPDLACESQLIEILKAFKEQDHSKKQSLPLYIQLAGKLRNDPRLGDSLNSLLNSLHQAGASLGTHMKWYVLAISNLQYAEQYHTNLDVLINAGFTLEKDEQLYEWVMEEDFSKKVRSDAAYPLAESFVMLKKVGASLPKDVSLFQALKENIPHRKALADGFRVMLEAGISPQVHANFFDAVTKEAKSSETSFYTYAEKLGQSFAVLMSAGVSFETHRVFYEWLMPENKVFSLLLSQSIIALLSIGASLEKHKRFYDAIFRMAKVGRSAGVSEDLEYVKRINSAFAILKRAGISLEKYPELYEFVINDQYRADKRSEGFVVIQKKIGPYETYRSLYEEMGSTPLFTSPEKLEKMFSLLDSVGGSLPQHEKFYCKVMSRDGYEDELLDGFAALKDLGAGLDQHEELYSLLMMSNARYARKLKEIFTALSDIGATLKNNKQLYELAVIRCDSAGEIIAAIKLLKQIPVSFQEYPEFYDLMIKNATELPRLRLGIDTCIKAGFSFKENQLLYEAMINRSKFALELAECFKALKDLGATLTKHRALFEAMIDKSFYSKSIIKSMNELSSQAFPLEQYQVIYLALINDDKSRETFVKIMNLLKNAGFSLPQHQALFDALTKANAFTDTMFKCLNALIPQEGFFLDQHQALLMSIIASKETLRHEFWQSFSELQRGGVFLSTYLEFYQALVKNGVYLSQMYQCFTDLKNAGIYLSDHPELYSLYLENIASQKEIDACIFRMTNDLKMPIPLNLEYMRAVILSPEITRFKLETLLSLGFNLRSHRYIYDIFLTGDTISSLSRYDFVRITQMLDEYLSSNSLLELDHPDYPKQSAEIQKIISDGLIARREMVEGPQNKSVETLEMERLLRKIIRTDVAHIGMHYDKVVGYVLMLPDEPDVSINLLLAEANFNHIELTADEINQLGQKIQEVAGDFNGMSSRSDNFIVSRLPEAARIALNFYVGDRRYRNMNRLFRGVEQTSEQRYVWISPVSSQRNLLANFLCGCIVNWSAAELPRLLHGSSERILLEKILAAMPPTMEIKRLRENRALYQAWIQEGLKKGVITVEESQTLEALFFNLHLIYPQYGLVDRAENILRAEEEGEVSVLERRLANIVSAPSVISMSVRNEGSPDFQHEGSMRTKLETDVSGRITVNSREGEILFPHGTKFFYAKGKEMLLAKEVYALNYDQHTRGYWSLMALEKAYKSHLSKPYTEAGSMVTVHGTPIYRPNHGLAHTFRVMTYIPLVIDYFAQHAKDAAFKLFCQNLSLREREWLKVAAAYSITGRESEIAASENPARYDKIREDCMNHLHDFLTKYPMHFPTPEMQERMEHIVRYMGNPGYEIALMGKPAINQHESEDERKQRNFLHRILTIAHKLDLPRCYEPAHFESAMQLCRELSDMSPAQQIDYDRMVGYAIDLLKAHGNALQTDLSDSGEYITMRQEYCQPFDLVSTNLRVLMQISETVPYPWPLNPCQYNM